MCAISYTIPYSIYRCVSRRHQYPYLNRSMLLRIDFFSGGYIRNVYVFLVYFWMGDCTYLTLQLMHSMTYFPKITTYSTLECLSKVLINIYIRSPSSFPVTHIRTCICVGDNEWDAHFRANEEKKPSTTDLVHQNSCLMGISKMAMIFSRSPIPLVTRCKHFVR